MDGYRNKKHKIRHVKPIDRREYRETDKFRFFVTFSLIRAIFFGGLYNTMMHRAKK